MKRTVIAELLDNDNGSPSEVSASLADLRWLNRWFGGVATTKSMVEKVARQTGAKSLSLLEVASGAGYVPYTIRDRLAARGVQLHVSLMDRAPSHLNGNLRSVAGDARELPFANGSFDLVSCCLFAHHLAPEDLTKFACEALRVARVALLINDLVRSALHLAIAHAGKPLYRSRITRHDAPASVRQAYTPHEMWTMIGRSPAAKVEIERRYLYRMGVIAWKR